MKRLDIPNHDNVFFFTLYFQEHFCLIFSVMDLSISKTPEASRPSSGSEKGDRSDRGDLERDDVSMPPPKTPSSESECEGKDSHFTHK